MFYFFEIRCLFRNWSIDLRKKPIHLSVSAQYSVKSTLHLQNVSYWFDSLNYASWPHSLRELGVRTTAQEVKTHLLHGTDKVGVALLSLSPFFPSHFVTRHAARYSIYRPLESSAVLFSGNPLWRLFMRADDSITWTDLAGEGYGSGTGGRRFSSYRIKGSIAYKVKSTELRRSLCTWLWEIGFCCCLTSLPGPAWLLLNKICKDFFSALYFPDGLKLA